MSDRQPQNKQTTDMHGMADDYHTVKLEEVMCKRVQPA